VNTVAQRGSQRQDMERLPVESRFAHGVDLGQLRSAQQRGVYGQVTYPWIAEMRGHYPQKEL